MPGHVEYLQVFDGLFGHQLFLLVPLHRAHHAAPDDADHGLLREVGLLHLLLGEGDNLSQEGDKLSHVKETASVQMCEC